MKKKIKDPENAAEYTIYKPTKPIWKPIVSLVKKYCEQTF